MANEKLYPFSVSDCMDDIECYRNHLYEAMSDMEEVDSHMDVARYDSMYDLYYGDLQDLYDVLCRKDGSDTAYLTEGQIRLAQRIISLMSNKRTQKEGE